VDEARDQQHAAIAERDLGQQDACHRHEGVEAVALCSGCLAPLCQPCNDAGELPDAEYEAYCDLCRPAPAVSAPPVVVAASFLPRLFAVIVDFVLLDLARAVLHGLIGWEMAVIRQDGTFVWPSLLLAGLLYGAYHCLFWAQAGATPGKRLLGLRVVRAADDGQRDLLHAALRCLGYLVSYFSFFIGFLASLWDRERRGWHDHLAGTRVVRITE